MKPRIAFLSIQNMEGFVADDQLAEEPLRRRGYELETIPWDEDVDWNQYRAAVVRTTWDYQDRLGEFLQVMARIDASDCRLFNPLEIIRWNTNKTYLKELAERGVPVVPTLFASAGEPIDLSAFFVRLQCHDIVVKPTIGANAFDTFRVRNEEALGERAGQTSGSPPGVSPSGDRSPAPGEEIGGTRMGGPAPLLPLSLQTEERIEAVFHGREYMVQPFVREIVDPGETSLFYFNGRYSHAILKTPAPGDFRVQEEHGGRITPADPPRDLVETCRAIASLFDPEPLYARVDIVRTGELFLLMEVELIEPALYFRIVPGSADRFADALVARLREGTAP